jgi:hypothetical protein
MREKWASSPLVASRGVPWSDQLSTAVPMVLLARYYPAKVRSAAPLGIFW